MPNRLATETSLYLRQHADNPVDWWPWCDEAFAEARERDVPVLLSVGYSSCHWCHVMAHESFEDPTTAGTMNTDFVPVKVDREERPDVDALYMQATVAMTGQGGWPMTAFLLPSGEPFWAGTYFPPEPRHGMPSFLQVMDGVSEAWRERRGQVMKQADLLARGIRDHATVRPVSPVPGAEMSARALGALAGLYDHAHGGFGGAPKFPPSVVIDLLLRRHMAGRGDAAEFAMAVRTLDAMAAGGVFDQVGGGFHRYSVDDIWLVPHFEKMLYDNALLLRNYALAAWVTGEPRFADVADRIATYLMREMLLPSGAFAAAQDADSPGGEGAFFTWTPDDVHAVLEPDAAAAVMVRFGVTDRGNFEGRCIPHVVGPGDPAIIDPALAALYEARRERPAPDRDDKVVASWNGLAIGALAEGGVLMNRPEWVEAARTAAHVVLDEMRVDGRLMRVHAGGRTRHLGTLDDHADLADGLLALHAADFDPAWLMAARDLADTMLALFADPDGNGFFLSGSDAPALLARVRDHEDHPSPSGNSQAAWVLARLHLLTGEARYRTAAEGALRPVTDSMTKWPQAFGRALLVMELLDGPGREVAIAGVLTDARTTRLIAAARRHAGPFAVICAGDPDDPRAAAAAPLLAGRGLVDGSPAAYVCSGFTCRTPVTTPEALTAALRTSPPF
ncbi:MAG: thioredoxin domain-containing protein [Thermoleophilia bacterium]|nr:thioredoxin domain-containing protein [Thermoleophilia bacterium]